MFGLAHIAGLDALCCCCCSCFFFFQKDAQMEDGPTTLSPKTLQAQVRVSQDGSELNFKGLLPALAACNHLVDLLDRREQTL